MKQLTDKFILTLINKNIIKEEDKEIYSYGFNQILFIMLNFITILIIGISFNMLFETIIFMITYIPIRIYAGGYHARTQTKCYIFSVFMLILALYIIKLKLMSNILIIILLSIISSIIIISLAPVEDINKPLDEKETEIYKKRTIKNLIIILVFLIISLILNKRIITSCICVSLLFNSVMLLFGNILNFFNIIFYNKKYYTYEK